MSKIHGLLSQSGHFQCGLFTDVMSDQIMMSKVGTSSSTQRSAITDPLHNEATMVTMQTLLEWKVLIYSIRNTNSPGSRVLQAYSSMISSSKMKYVQCLLHYVNTSSTEAQSR